MRAEEERQFREYVAGNTAALRRTAYLLCGDWVRAEDLVQDALCRLFVVWRRASTVDHLHLYTRKILIRGSGRLRTPRSRRLRACHSRTPCMRYSSRGFVIPISTSEPR